MVLPLSSHEKLGGWVRAFGAVFLLALGIRLVGAFLLSAGGHASATAHHEHASIARSVAEGNGFRFNFFGKLEAPVLTSIEAPLIPGILAGSYLLFGIESQAAYRAVLLLQIVVSSLTVCGVGWIAYRITRHITTALLTSFLATVYPPLVVSALHIQALPWNLFWLVLLLGATFELKAGTLRLGAILFVIGGIGGLLSDPILAAAIVPLIAFLVWNASGSLQRSILPIGITAAITLGISPWLVRNYQVHHRFIFIKDSFPFVLWQGNCVASLGTDKLLVPQQSAQELAGAEWNPSSASRLAFEARAACVSVNSSLTVDQIAELQSLPSEIARMDWFREKAKEALLENPLRYAWQCCRRLWFWLWFDPTNPRSYLWHYRISYLAILVVSFPSFWICRTSLRNAIPLAAAALGLTLTHAFIITSARFRIPLELLWLFPAGMTVGYLFQLVASRIPTIAVRISAQAS